jgi:hypothetical protein
MAMQTISTYPASRPFLTLLLFCLLAVPRAQADEPASAPQPAPAKAAGDPFAEGPDNTAAEKKSNDSSADRTQKPVSKPACNQSDNRLDSRSSTFMRGQKDSPIEILSSTEIQILDALEQPASYQFIEEPLQDVVIDLKDLHGIEIQLDEKALVDAGIAQDTPIVLTSRSKIPLRSLLSLLRRKYGLYYLIQDDMLLITTKDEAESEENLVRKVYPVGDLVETDDEDEDSDYGSLVRAIITTIDGNTWDESGGAGTVVRVESSKCLVIAQTRDVHDRVQELLRALRIARKIAAGDHE